MVLTMACPWRAAHISPGGIVPRSYTEKNLEFFQKYTIPEPNTGCILWEKTLNQYGYGQFTDSKRKTQTAHRAIWILHYGSIPEDKQINHKCDVRACVNIEHLYLGSQKDNMQDKVKKGRSNAQLITHCPSGHEYDEANTIYDNNGKHRRCRLCRKIQKQKYHNLKKETKDQRYFDRINSFSKKRYAENREAILLYYKKRYAHKKLIEAQNEK